MEKKEFKADFLLLITAAIWGFAFVAQRVSMDFIGPFTFNAARFSLGAIFLFVLILLRKNLAVRFADIKKQEFWIGSLLAGLALFAGASLQQIGIVYTTAGKAGFITGLYVVLVPLLGIAIKHKSSLGNWIGAVMAVIGLYFLSVTGTMTIEYGDFLVLIGAFCWAFHVLIIDHYSKKLPSMTLAFMQFSICAVISFICAISKETIILDSMFSASLPILYSGFLSVGVAFTLQVLAQKDAHPTHAAIILSMEALFALIGGLLLLHENLTTRGTIGCILMFSGMIISQIYTKAYTKKETEKNID